MGERGRLVIKKPVGKGGDDSQCGLYCRPGKAHLCLQAVAEAKVKGGEGGVWR